ncbi:metal ABC transporter solute-binding protein, Zn/Mn family [Kocuria rhizophila]|uniref:metal ABC transporter solute-binding protein, Zn/Mn family n=1 Tax=Kocuria rhizophila TaxID=72000 RepID=UPI0021A42E9F|nr:zinc ABC transporter substrate-binding protein [Kocuria rhizophila]MCT2249497.1 zinc ABC transporter substrate-binding protein [Kocuria rhizophila]
MRVSDRTNRHGARAAAVLGLLGALTLTGCSGGSAQEGGSGSEDSGKIRVTTSTNVYSDLAAQVGGDKVEATPVIHSSAQDPHSYEATPQDRLAVEKADLLVRNGGGYDQFMTDLAPEGARVVDAVEVSGLQSEQDRAAAEEHEHDHGSGEHHHHHGGFNEHVWYDLETMTKVATQVAGQLGEVDPANAGYYTDNAARVGQELTALDERLGGLGAGGGYVATEPVPGYLLEDAGLHDDTPTEFAEAIDAETDAPPAALNDTLKLVADEHIALLAFNQQTSTGQTERLRTTAQEAGTPVVEFTETVPDGRTYQQWMAENVDHVAEAVKK